MISLLHGTYHNKTHGDRSTMVVVGGWEEEEQAVIVQ
jgi:hypothetical protein